MSAVLHVNGWVVSEMNGEPTVRDTDLADKLGYERPRAIRQLIKNMINNGSFGVATPHGDLERTSKFSPKESEVFYLNQKQALKVISKSETKIADAIMDEVIDVFLAYRKGQLQPVLDYEGGKVAHILHGFKHELNPTAFLNVGLIKKFEKMFGARNVREFYSQLLGIRMDEVKHLNTDEVAAFYDSCVVVDNDAFTPMNMIYDAYCAWCKENGHMDVLLRDTFLKRFGGVAQTRATQRRINGDRPRGYRVQVSL